MTSVFAFLVGNRLQNAGIPRHQVVPTSQIVEKADEPNELIGKKLDQFIGIWLATPKRER